MQLVDRIYAAPFVWGVSDCCTRACDVFAALHGIDPMQAWRGRYACARGAARLVRSFGGWLAMCCAMAARAGLVVGADHPGALGVVEIGRRQALAVRVPRGWAAPVEGGSVIVSRAVACWGIG